jgi:pimeloyl-ACP methyl ester carboxylesterase
MLMPFYRMPDGEALFVREFGQGEPVVVLSGLGMHSWQWLPFLYQHKKQYRFIIPDWRGFGGSDQCAVPALDAISSHWQDLNSLIQQQNLQQFKLIGYSMGATTAMHGMQYGQLGSRLNSYLQIDQAPKIGVDENWPYGLFGDKHQQFKALLIHLSEFLHQHAEYTHIQQMDVLQRKNLVELWLQFIELQASNKISPFLFKLAVKRPVLQRYILPTQRLDYLRWYIDNYLHHQEDYREALSQLSCPTLFFTGAQSTLYAAEGQRQVMERMPNAKQVLFHQSGHTPLLTEPLKFSQEIAQFLKLNP